MSNDTPYALHETAEVLTPSLVVFPDIVKRNIAAVVAMAGSPARLRPHVKTHKTIEIVKLLLAAGVTKHKCATLAEAELLARAGVTDVLVAYPLVGPNPARLMKLKLTDPQVQFTSLIDHPDHITALATAASTFKLRAGFMVDVNVGQNRTGTDLVRASSLYAQAAAAGLEPAGLQAYDGHNHMDDRREREAAVAAWLERVLAMKATIERAGHAVPRIVVGGTPTFPVLAHHQSIPNLECSPGTFVLHDHGYGSKFNDLAALTPAAVLLTRVVSKPTVTRVTLDLGTKAVATDPPLAKRVKLLGTPPSEIVGQNEEHLILETPHADQFAIGQLITAIPGHICPTVALHKEMLTVEAGRFTGAWRVLARDRELPNL
jgi:D-serine deaminase-like pyridoxal phosphate-dependent protein